MYHLRHGFYVRFILYYVSNRWIYKEKVLIKNIMKLTVVFHLFLSSSKHLTAVPNQNLVNVLQFYWRGKKRFVEKIQAQMPFSHGICPCLQYREV